MRSAERSQDSNRYWPKQEKLAASVCLDMLNRHLRQSVSLLPEIRTVIAVNK